MHSFYEGVREREINTNDFIVICTNSELLSNEAHRHYSSVQKEMVYDCKTPNYVPTLFKIQISMCVK